MKIYHKVALALIAGQLAIFLGQMGFLQNMVVTDTAARIQAHHEVIERLLKNTLSRDFTITELPIVERTLEDVAIDPLVAGIRLNGIFDRQIDIGDTNLLSQANDDHETSHITLTFGDGRTGQLQIIYSSSVAHDVEANFNDAAIPSMLLGTAAAISFGLIIVVFVARRISTVKDLSNLLASGNFTNLPTVSGNDEVAEMARTLSATAESIRQRNEEFEAIIGATPGSIYFASFSKSGQQLELRFLPSNAFEQVFGFPPDQYLNAGNISDLVHDDDRSKWREKIQTSMGKEGYYQFEFRTIGPDGNIRWILNTAIVTFEPDGTISRRGVHIDITRLKAAEAEAEAMQAEAAKRAEQLADSQYNFKTLAEATPGAIVLVQISSDNLLKKLEYMSPNCTDTFGHPPEYFKPGNSPWDHAHPDDKPGVLLWLGECTSRRTNSSTVFRYNHPERGYIWLHAFVNNYVRNDGQLIRQAFFLDVTEQKELEQQLEESRAFYRDFLETLPGIVFKNVITEGGEVIAREWLSPNLEEHYGYTEEQLVDREFYKSLFLDGSNERRQEALRHAIETGDYVEAELKMRHGDGGIRWFAIYAAVSPLEDGNYTYSGILLDITARKETEAELDQKSRQVEDSLLALEEANSALEQSREYYKDILETLPGVVFRNVVSKDLSSIDRVFLSDGAVAQHGYSIEQLTDDDFFQSLFDGDFYEQRKAAIIRGIETGDRIDFEVRMKHADGDYHWYRAHATAKPLADGKYTYNGLYLDVTDRKMAELELEEKQLSLELTNKKLEESEALYRDVVETIPGLVFQSTATPDAVISKRDYMSPQAESIFGYGVEEILKRDFFERTIIPEDLEKTVQALKECIEQRTPFRVDYRFKRADGEIRWLQVNANTRRLRNGNVTVHGVGLDVTEAKRAEIAIEEVNKGLERLVENKTKDLQSANSELETAVLELHQTQDALVQSEKLASLGQLVAGIAHEINTPIGVSLTAITNLADRSTTTLTSFETNSLSRSMLEAHFGLISESNSIILSNLRRASELIRSFKQVAVDQTSQEKRTVDIGQYTNEILKSLSPILKPHAISVSVDMPKSCRIDLQTGNFAQILTNLITNASMHAFDQEMQESKELVIAGKLHNDELEVIVQDNGKGMPDSVAQKIFDPFYTTKRNAGGTGLGMHIVYNLVTQGMGGSINCETEPGIGTTFTVRFPVNEYSDPHKTTLQTLH